MGPAPLDPLVDHILASCIDALLLFHHNKPSSAFAHKVDTMSDLDTSSLTFPPRSPAKPLLLPTSSARVRAAPCSCSKTTPISASSSPRARRRCTPLSSSIPSRRPPLLRNHCIARPISAIPLRGMRRPISATRSDPTPNNLSATTSPSRLARSSGLVLLDLGLRRLQNTQVARNRGRLSRAA